MPKPRILALSVFRGGNAKTTTALSAAAYYSTMVRPKERVLLLDMDSQASASEIFDFAEAPTMMDVLAGRCPMAEAIQAIGPNLDAVPSTEDLASAETDLPAKGRAYRLRDALAPVLPNYDRVIIDTPPALSVLSLLSLACATEVVVPIQADYFSTRAVDRVLRTAEDLASGLNPALRVLGILVTRYPPNTVLGRQIVKALREGAEETGVPIFKAVIREGVAIREAQMRRQSIFSYAPKSNQAEDYKRFFREMSALEREADNG